MILRLLRASMLPEDVPTVLDALRADADEARSWPGMVAWTHGIRRERKLVHGLTVSAWTDFDSLRRVAGGRPDRDISGVSGTAVLRDVTTEHYELAEPAAASGVVLGGDVLGVIWGTIRPNVEGAVQSMIRSIRPTVSAAGVTTLYVGRRIVRSRTEIVVVAPWRDRLSLHEFARSRSGGAIDPAFTSQLTSWRFETYDSLSPERLAIEPTGPAVLVVDDERRCIDTTAGAEAVLGFPGELLLGRTIDELTSAPAPRTLARRWAAIRAAHGGELALRLAPWPGAEIGVQATVECDVPRPGLHSLRLESGAAARGTPALPRAS
jgi:PAS domain-containing protein